VNVISMRPEGEGSIKKAAALLESKLAAEGLFDAERKRPLPYPPARIGLVASSESAAYADFTKIINARWGGVAIECIDVQVQGEAAPEQIVAAIEHLNQMAELPEVIVIIRGGGSAEDLYSFSTEQVTRAVAASRVPTLVAIGHEVDWSLAELAADQRASTPSNAAELLVPDRRDMQQQLGATSLRLHEAITARLKSERQALKHASGVMQHAAVATLRRERNLLASYQQLLDALNPRHIMQRGYAIVRADGSAIRHRAQVTPGAIVSVEVSDGHFDATVR
jgi:exodeoxyribonuclease VII large subunit